MSEELPGVYACLPFTSAARLREEASAVLY